MRPEHLSESELSGYVDNDLSADERRRVQLHVESCADCRAALVDVMRAVDSYSPPNAAPATHPVLARPRRAMLYAGVLSALAASVVIFVMRPPAANQSLAGESNVRTASEGRRVIAAVIPARDAAVDARDVRLTWRASGESNYRVALLTEGGEPLWMHDTSDTTVVLPREIDLRSGLYYWRVDGIGNGIAASSGPQRFRVR